MVIVKISHFILCTLTHKAVESTILKVITFDHPSCSATAKQLTQPFPVAQFIANLRILPDLKCCTHFDSLKSIDEVMAEYLIESKQHV
jgi:hypothetical protein